MKRVLTLVISAICIAACVHAPKEIKTITGLVVDDTQDGIIVACDSCTLDLSMLNSNPDSVCCALSNDMVEVKYSQGEKNEVITLKILKHIVEGEVTDVDDGFIKLDSNDEGEITIATPEERDSLDKVKKNDFAYVECEIITAEDGSTSYSAIVLKKTEHEEEENI